MQVSNGLRKGSAEDHDRPLYYFIKITAVYNEKFSFLFVFSVCSAIVFYLGNIGSPYGNKTVNGASVKLLLLMVKAHHHLHEIYSFDVFLKYGKRGFKILDTQKTVKGSVSW